METGDRDNGWPFHNQAMEEWSIVHRGTGFVKTTADVAYPLSSRKIYHSMSQAELGSIVDIDGCW